MARFQNRDQRRKTVYCGTIVFLSFISIPIFTECTGPTRFENSSAPWDSSFIIGGIQFPNDSIYQRAVVGMGELWRMHRFFDKCALRPSVRVGFIGGSITDGAKASVPARRYSSIFCSCIKHMFPRLGSVIEINSGVGGTGSRYGCSRLKADVLESGPDMIVIEFAVNDFGTGDSMYIRSCMEGLVRQCLVYKNDVPVILLFMSKGDGTNVQNLHTDVGRYYNLPMISYRDAVWPLVERNWAMFDTFFYYDQHPNDNGHFLCSYLLYSYLKNALQSPDGAELAVSPYVYSDIYQYAGILTSADSVISMVTTGWSTIAKEKGRIGLTTAKDSARMVLRGRYRELCFRILMQPDSSSIHIIIDNGIIDSTINNYCALEYTQFVHLSVSGSSNEHRAEIIHQGGSAFSIEYLLYAKKPE